MSLEGQAKPAIEALHKRCAEIGRDPGEIGIEGWVILNHCNVHAGERQQPGADQLRSPDEWALDVRAWKAAGATHINCWTTWGNLHRVEEHVALATRFKEVVDAC